MMRTMMGLGLVGLMMGCSATPQEQRGEKRRQAVAVPIEIALFAPIGMEQETSWQELRAELEAPMADGACTELLLLPQLVVRRHDGVDPPTLARRPPVSEQYDALISAHGSRAMTVISNVPAVEILRKQELTRLAQRPMEAWLRQPSKGTPREVSELTVAHKGAPYAMALGQPLEPSVALPEGTQRPESAAALALAVARQACLEVRENRAPGTIWIVVNPPVATAPVSTTPAPVPQGTREPDAGVQVERLPIVPVVPPTRSKVPAVEPKRDVPSERVIPAVQARPCQGGVLDPECVSAPEFRQVVQARESREAPFTQRPAALTRHEIRR